MIGTSYEDHGSHGPADPTAVPAATGLFLFSVGGWLLNTARPWQKPGHPAILGLSWTVALALLLWGLVLLVRCVRTVHGSPHAPYENGEAGRGGENPARPAS
ncbi:hypothetical protein [Streptomyces sp. NPDC097981]|uniref:hypothetical protein n=1 Tax=Streptomyces sp. NPDC097981 TaxID=3155428 RepID=UPI003328D6B3